MSRSIARALAAASVYVTFAGGLAVAQQPAGHPRAAAPAAASALDDPTIVAIFDAANGWDIESGKLAAQKGTTADVREFGQMLARDHTMLRQQARDLAKKLGVRPTPPANFAMANDHAAAMAKLRAAKGAAFDRAFLQHEVAFHKAVIDAVTQTLLPAIRNQELAAFVRTAAPAFQGHMVAAQTRLDKLPAVSSR